MKPYKHLLEYYCIDDIRDALKEKYGVDIYSWDYGGENIEHWYAEEIESLDSILPCYYYVVLEKQFLYKNPLYFLPWQREILALIIKEYGDEKGNVVVKFLKHKE